MLPFQPRVAPYIMAITVIVLLAACGNTESGSTIEQAKKIQAAVAENTPGSVATSATGYMLTADVKGKHWAATSMIPPQDAGRIVGSYETDYIGLPYDKRSLNAGNKERLGPDNAVDVFIRGAPGGWLTTGGELEITSVGSEWVEGKFSVDMKSTTDQGTLQVTNGFFRIPAPAN